MADDEARIVSVIGGARRTSRWRIAEDTSVLTLFGRCLLDLREAETDAEELWFSVVSVFATVEIIVPEGTIVQPSGMAFLGASSCEVPAAQRSGPLPAIEIDAVTVFGSLRVHIGQRERVGLLRRLFRRGSASTPAATGSAPADDADGVVDELRMTAPAEDPLAALDDVELPIAEPLPPDARTEVDELDEVLDGVLGGGRDLLGPTGDDAPEDGAAGADGPAGGTGPSGEDRGGDEVPVTSDEPATA